jgi:hypothetical protein
MRATKTGLRAGALGIAAIFVTIFATIFAPGRLAVGADRNACGCYKTEGGSCYCDKKAKCGCPGECEPKGCEEKRQKDMDKEIREETKRAQSAERGQERTEKSGAPAPEKAPSGKALTAAQLHDLGKLLDLYVAQHPDDAAKSVGTLARELAHPAK